MKINGPLSSPVQSLGRRTITGREGDVDRITGLTSAGTSIADSLYKYKKEQDAIQLKRQRQQYGLKNQKDESSFWNQYGGKEFFNVEDLPEGVVTEGMKIKGRVPSAEVLPKMYNDYMSKSIKENSLIIEDESGRNSSFSDMKEKLLAKHSQIQVRANKSISKQIFSDQKINIQNAMNERRPDVALSILKDMEGSPSELREIKESVMAGTEIISYQDYITEGNIDKMKESLAYLSQPAADYEKSGNLDPAPRGVWKHKLELEIKRSEKESTFVNKAFKENLRYRIQTIRNNSESGKVASAETLLPLFNDIKLANEKTGGEFIKEQLELDDSIKLSQGVDYQNQLSSIERDNFADNLTMPGFTEERNQKLQLGLQAANEAKTAMENTNFMQSLSDSGVLGEDGLIPLDVRMDGDTWGNSIANRMVQMEVGQSQFGENLGGGPLTNEEAKRFSKQLSSMSPTKQQTILASTAKTMGPKSIMLFKQIAKSGDARTFSLAGMAIERGFVSNAETMLEGRKFIKENGDELKTIKLEIGYKLPKSLKNAYVNQPSKRAAVKEAIYSAYVGLNKNSADFNRLDNETYEKAIDIATGGLFEFGGRTVPVPEYGMEPEIMTGWLDTINSKFIDRIKPPVGMTSETFIKEFRDGGYAIEPGIETGTYIVLRAYDDSWVPLEKEGGGSYILPYDQSAERDKTFRTNRKEIERRREAALVKQLKKERDY